MIKYDANSLFEAVYDGTVTPRKLPEQLYAEIAEILKKGVDKGFNKGAQATGERFAKYELGSVDAALIEELTLNIYMFSAAKTFQQVLEMSNALVVDGRVASFSEFKSEANKIFEIYNKTWLKTEYDTSIGQSQNARRWSTFEQEKDLFPYLKYDAVMDANTSEICRPLDGILLPVGDPFWNTHAPLNHFNCRCFLRKISKFDEVKPTAKSKLNRVSKEINPMMQEVFKVNPGKTGECFDSAHPYFNVPKKYTKFAETNFGLPIPPKKISEPYVEKENDLSAKKEVNPLFKNSTLKVDNKTLYRGDIRDKGDVFSSSAKTKDYLMDGQHKNAAGFHWFTDSLEYATDYATKQQSVLRGEILQPILTTIKTEKLALLDFKDMVLKDQVNLIKSLDKFSDEKGNKTFKYLLHNQKKIVDYDGEISEKKIDDLLGYKTQGKILGNGQTYSDFDTGIEFKSWLKDNGFDGYRFKLFKDDEFGFISNNDFKIIERKKI